MATSESMYFSCEKVGKLTISGSTVFTVKKKV
jgi:hypothetical protein